MAVGGGALISDDNVLDDIEELTEKDFRNEDGQFRSHTGLLMEKGYSEEDARHLSNERVAMRYGGKQTKEDQAKQEERYGRLIRLGATEHHARAGSRDIHAFNAARIFLRAK